MRFRKSIQAVLTGDIVNSTRIPALTEQTLLKGLGEEFAAYTASFYRGDSFQVFVNDPAKSLRIALICRALAISLMEEGGVEADIRIGIGLGPVQLPVQLPAIARGEAFVLSGHGLDEIQDTDQRLLITSGHEMADIAFQVMADYLDSIYSKLTAKQARVLVSLLQGQTQQEVALKQGKSKSTISQLVSAGRWPEIEKLLQQFEKMINLLL